MTRRPDRRHGARIGAGAASNYDDRTLAPDVSVNGQPPRIRSDDSWQYVARIKCGDCSTVAVLVIVSRPGREPLLVAEVQVVEDWAARPVVTRTARQEVAPHRTLIADCPAHGAVTVPGDRAVEAARSGAVATMGGATRLVILHARPDGQRRPLPSSDAMTVTEANEWLGWSDTP